MASYMGQASSRRAAALPGTVYPQSPERRLDAGSRWSVNVCHRGKRQMSAGSIGLSPLHFKGKRQEDEQE